jgi:hypothetical protein
MGKRGNILSNILGLPWDTDPTRANTIRMQIYRADSVEDYDTIIDENREWLRNPEATRIWLKIKDERDPWAAVERMVRNRRATTTMAAVAALYTNALLCAYFTTLFKFIM